MSGIIARRLRLYRLAEARIWNRVLYREHIRTLLHTEFVALLKRAGVTQAAFARLVGVTARQVNNLPTGQAATPKWAALIAVMMQDTTPEALEIAVEAAEFSWNEGLGIPADSDVLVARQAMRALALLYHPGNGG